MTNFFRLLSFSLAMLLTIFLVVTYPIPLRAYAEGFRDDCAHDKTGNCKSRTGSGGSGLGSETLHAPSGNEQIHSIISPSSQGKTIIMDLPGRDRHVQEHKWIRPDGKGVHSLDFDTPSQGQDTEENVTIEIEP